MANFSDRRLKQLSQRLIFFERPDLVADSTRLRLAEGMRHRLAGNRNDPWMSVAKARVELSEICDCAHAGLAGYSNFLDTIR